MEILYLLIPVSVVLVFLIGAVFWWSLRHGQFEDMEGPAYRILMDDDSPPTVDGSVASKPMQDNRKP
ncbi:MAG: cbb3-type cytochrome oxidase assembly protein CcoS [Gammaproteobacteria bacterium]|nr:cbb3-type cytochrome oxidase assembly protein CcoS [Gammaproteobacteria bacterium]MBU1415087.1 cbb3-type cytochrome oxidase assembly protein CcoS [Gammaproteobacteria bacterium]